MTTQTIPKSSNSNVENWYLVNYAKKITRPFGIIGALFGLIALFGYAFNIEPLYRPFANGPATHPITALCMLCIGLMLGVSNNTKQLPYLIVLPLIVFVLTFIRMLDLLSGSSMLTSLTPFSGTVEAQLLAGKSNYMGINSSIMLMGIALSLLLYNQHHKAESQCFAFISLAIPMISLTGYAYNINDFYGQMSILTTTIGLILAISSITTTAGHGAVKAILSPYIGGKIARLQTIVGYLFPTIMGYLMVKSLSSSESDLFGLFVVAICWFIILMIAISAILQERSDKNRRIAEHQLAHAAMTEPLTGLANRRKFNQVAAQTLTDSERTKQAMWLFIIDIDHFKKVNDIGGHDMGDRVLVEVANVLKRSVRNDGLVCRIGGEEFAVILSNLDGVTAHIVANNIRQNIADMVIEYWSEQHGPITASIGCTSNQGNTTIESMHKLADTAIYQAKNNGRNQVVFMPSVPAV
ncbi:GGDEF domain-containing protein [Pseudoalteromonas sp. MMG022]|uniref:GGDEF domain-containing protein n=1 Tax=Pseudoalteromonas sp. MMG022 TaxID=2909978 RepID=UPI001F1903CA|nr:GGDEF domain-containing protein [Pseudoalteromonas sp. MMG022]MCF6436902.1 GGDEF domain-containing protein [Pseudoalteromonas sp. MMG022]